MGSYSFRWEHPADEVFVTGTFDSWGKSVKLDKKDIVHEKTVALPKTDEKILYKFVADGEWKHDHTAKTETDSEGNVNNVIYPEDIKPPFSAAQTISSVGPSATTTAMAGEQPKEEQKSAPGAFPETRAPDDDQSFSVNPIPASSGTGNPIQLAPGEKVPDPSTINDNTIASTVRDDPELQSNEEGNQAVSVQPIPATGGIGNPIQLAPGEKVPDPSTLTSNTVDSTVTHDKESYEKGGAIPASAPPVGTTQADRDTPAAEVFGNLSGPGPMIPESSMAMGDSKDITKEDTGPAISSVAPGSTTNELAGQQPIEPRGEAQVVKEEDNNPNISSVGPDSTTAGLAGEQPVEPRGQPEVTNKDTDPTVSSVGPDSTTTGLAGEQPVETRGVPEVVTESQQEAKADPEASASPHAVEEKKEVEDELLKKVPEASTTSESGVLGRSENNSGPSIGTWVAAGGAAAAGAAGAAVAANEMAKDKSGTDPKSAIPESVQKTVDEKAKESSIPQKATGESTTDAARETTADVPEEVTASQKEAGQDAEAAGNAEAVTEKSEVEKELLSKVPESDAKGEPAPTDSAAAATTAPTSTTETTSPSGAPQLGDPTAGVAPISMDDSKPTESTTDGLNASKDSEAQPSTVSKVAEEEKKPLDTRDVSPMAKPSGQTQPLATTGTETSAIPRKNGASSSTPQKRNSIIDRLKGSTPESSKKTESSSTPATSDSKKEKRRSFFGKIKDKLKSKSEETLAGDNGSPKFDKGKGRAVGARNVENQPPDTLLHSNPIVPSPPPFLPPRKASLKSAPHTRVPPFPPPSKSYEQLPAHSHSTSLPRLQLPETADDASIISRGKLRKMKLQSNSLPEPSSSEPSTGASASPAADDYSPVFGPTARRGGFSGLPESMESTTPSSYGPESSIDTTQTAPAAMESVAAYAGLCGRGELDK